MLTGECVTLRPVKAGDLPVLYELMMDPDTWTASSDKPLWPMPFPAFEAIYAKRAADEEAEFVIEVSGALVGRCALFEFDLLARNASLGIGLLPVHRRKGYGRDAVAVLLDYAFDKRNLHRVQLEVLADNDAALSTYKASGFVEEGRLREHAYTAGSFVDLVVMSVLRSDWLAARPGR